MNEPIRVLIVDDHQMLAESLTRLLGHDPVIDVIGVAPTVHDGLERARESHPDLVIMDYHLPDGDGVTATSRIREELPGTKVIILTGSDRPAYRWAAERAGASAWMRKTRAVHDLISCVHRVHEGEQVVDEDDLELPRLDDLVLHYQPVIDLTSQEVVGFEALVRWQHPELGLVGPGYFLPLAEETGYIVEVDRRVRELAVAQLAWWQETAHPHPPPFVSVNLSAVEVDVPELVVDVSKLISEFAIDPAGLVLEVTETMLLRDADDIVMRLQELKDLGLRLALDDFGTAFSSLSYLRRFPFDHLKIDTSFTAELPDVPRSVVLVEAIQQLAAAFGLRGIAEGIERAEQAECLQRLGWNLAQGYLYSPAVAPAEAEAMLVRRPQSAPSASDAVARR
jgi:EAL domain-containing protein (putative c-di-GMP-specific phosphodiesterase class I)